MGWPGVGQDCTASGSSRPSSPVISGQRPMAEAWLVRPATSEHLAEVVRFNCDMALETENRQLDPRRVRLGLERLMTTPALGRALVVTHPDGGVVGSMAVTTEWSDWRNGQ